MSCFHPVTPAGGTSIALYEVTGLADTTHTITITRTAGTLYLCGANIRKTSGLQVHNLGLGGARISDFNFAVQPYVAWYFLKDTIPPDFCVIDVMTNEAFTSVPVATFKTNLDALLAGFATYNIPVLLVAEPEANTLDLTAYRTALYEVAVSRDLPVVDMSERWGSWSGANALGMFFDNFHPNAAGYADYAAAVAGALR